MSIKITGIRDTKRGDKEYADLVGKTGEFVGNPYDGFMFSPHYDHAKSYDLNHLYYEYIDDGEAEDVSSITEAKKQNGFFGVKDGFSWAVNINGIKGGNEPRSESFGWQLDNRKIIDAFKKSAKKTRVDAKGKPTLSAVKSYLKSIGATEYYAKWKPDSSTYKDDSVEVWIKSTDLE